MSELVSLEDMTLPGNDTPEPHKLIRAWRRYLGLTQEDLAARVELSTPGISMIETGAQNVTLAKLTQIAEAFEISLAELMSPPPGSKAKRDISIRREIVEIYESLPEHLQPVYLAQVRALQAGAQAAEPELAETKKNPQ